MGNKIKVRLTEDELTDLLSKVLFGGDQSGLLQNILGGGKFDQDSLKKFVDSILSGKSGKSLSTTSSGSVDSRWMDITKKIIDNFEGGYWNYWECKNHPWHSMYSKSGETLFGLDRKAGKIENLGPDGQEFFRVIDDEKKKLGMSNFCKKWTYNYRGGDLENRLKTLASKIMYNEYKKNMSNYVKDPETKKRIEGNDGLLFHMAYATWNGPGYFQKFAKTLDRAVKEGKSDQELLQIAKNNRTSSFTGAWAKATTRVNSFIDNAGTDIA
jgi:hypothetical protein